MSLVSENRPGWNERQAFLQDRAQGSATFVHLVWPVLQKQCPEFHEGVLRLVEGRDHDLVASELDTCAGIDAYQRTTFGLRGIGVRVQWNINYRTFTVRISRPSGALTEYQKRARTLTHREEGFLYPHWTIQAYVSQPGPKGTLLAVAVAKTAELYHYIDQRARSGQGFPQSCATRGGERFLVIEWGAYQQSGRYCFVLPASDQHARDERHALSERLV